MRLDVVVIFYIAYVAITAWYFLDYINPRFEITIKKVMFYVLSSLPLLLIVPFLGIDSRLSPFFVLIHLCVLPMVFLYKGGLDKIFGLPFYIFHNRKKIHKSLESSFPIKTWAICPFCKEKIKQGAIVCKHCQRDIPPAE